MPFRHEEVSLGGRLYGQVALSDQGTSNFRGALKLNYTTNTNKSPQLVFTAAITAASLQLFALFTLPGLTIEPQQNSTQRPLQGDAVVCEKDQNHQHVLCSLLQEAEKANASNKLKWIMNSIETFASLVSAISVIIIFYQIRDLNAKLTKEKDEMGQILIDAGTKLKS